ncbi:hypothetical protein [Streptomyces sparsogenes]|uniref:hypothetical protein n=1 Tax=Streptomyces sparsogenes TaxID=67365 RepID=UPI00082413E0|nr:hypothetical protein [Streptomyces sparsogenes]
MRSTRALIAGAALAASLTLGAPAAAFAADVSDPGGHGGYSNGQESEDYGSGGSWKEKESKGKEEGDFGKGKEESGFGKEDFGKGKEGYGSWGSGSSWKEREHGKPHGGVHTGGGGMATTGSGMAAGSVLLLGGLGAGAYALRRRKPVGNAI